MTTKIKASRQAYTILSGEGEQGTSEYVNLTPIGLKRRLTAERCGGDRWARAYYGHGCPAELQPVESDISQAAAAMGRKGGSVKSDAKAKAARKNGKKGGRPAASPIPHYHRCHK